MNQYKILAHEWTTCPLIELPHYDGALVTVVIETGIQGWKAYRAFIRAEQYEQYTEYAHQLIAGYGRKLDKDLAVMMFPKFDPEMYDQ